ncbi:MAG: hypothetical protein AAF432_02705 [Planctomycetota bacterium]
MTRHILGPSIAAIALTAIAPTTLAAPVGEEVNYPALEARLGGSVPDGTNVVVGQVESNENNIPGRYSVAPTDGQFVNLGITFIEMSGPATFSDHARNVAYRMYGETLSITPDIPTVHIWETVNWLTSGYLNVGTANDPLVAPGGIKIFNNSWAAATSVDNDILRRLDGVVARDDVLMINGVPNAGQNGLPLPSWSYNGIAVGLANGNHISVDTSGAVDGSGRMKPELVVDGSLTSFVTPIVSACCALLIDAVREVPGNPTLANAERSEVIKAILLAGATRNASWTNNPATSGTMRGVTARPLDNVFGAGVPDIDQSHLMIFAGEQDASTAFPSEANVSNIGWDLATMGLGETYLYRFDVPATASEASFAATWHRRLSSGFTIPNTTDINLELARFNDSGGLDFLVGDNGLGVFESGNVVSESAVDNIELLHLRNLIAGDYLLFVSRGSGGSGEPWDVALAWTMDIEIPVVLCPQDCAPDNGDGTYGNGVVNIDDLIAVINSFDELGGPCDGAPDNGDGTFGNNIVNIDDLIAVINEFGPCPTP